MQIWVDADACPNTVKEILFRAAERTETGVILVANQAIRTPPSRHVRAVQVASGFDKADDYIVEAVAAGDLVITADIPLAADVIEKGALALNPRGELYTADSIRSRLNMRDFMDTMRASGVELSSTPALSSADKQRFANSLDRWLARKSS